MDRYLTEEHVRLRERVKDFAREAIEPVAKELDESCMFPWENVKAMGEMGLLGVPVPRELGGMGLDYLSYILVVEELAKVDASHSITVSAHTTLGLSPILAFGTDAQKERFMPPLASGEVLGGFGLTEPGAGSDAGGTRTRAVRDGEGYRINGSKIFITHAGVGEIFVVTAVTDPERGARGISSFIVVQAHRGSRRGSAHRVRAPGRPAVQRRRHARARRKTRWGGGPRTPGSSSSRTPASPRISGSAPRAWASSTS